MNRNPLQPLVRAITLVTCITATLVDCDIGCAQNPIVVKPALQLRNSKSADQDDACIWVNQKNPGQSTIIASDKRAGQLFVYDLAGKPLQSVPLPKPGNIDIRDGFPLGGKLVDLVVVNQRSDGFKLAAFTVDPDSRWLTRVDQGNIETGPNYGGCLYHSRKTGRFYFITTSTRATIEQYELTDDGTGHVIGNKVRSWRVRICEGAVADDEAGMIYISEESAGVWQFPAEPDVEAKGRLVAKIGEHGLTGDVEGIALGPQPDSMKWLIVSDQGRNRFVVYEIGSEVRYKGTFAVEGAEKTDGLDISISPLGMNFPNGLFVCHTDAPPRPLLVTPWPDIERAIQMQTPLPTK